jgi:hypothetical protein
MRLARIALVSALIALGALASAPAPAHPVHGRVAVFVGGPLWYPYYYPYPYYPYPYPYYPVPIASPTPPTRYIEQGQEGADDAQDYWYYCTESKTYYPYVKECPGGWLRVVPQAAPAR